MDTVRAGHGIPADGQNCLSGNFKAERNIGAKWENVYAGLTYQDISLFAFTEYSQELAYLLVPGLLVPVVLWTAHPPGGLWRALSHQ